MVVVLVFSLVEHCGLFNRCTAVINRFIWSLKVQQCNHCCLVASYLLFSSYLLPLLCPSTPPPHAFLPFLSWMSHSLSHWQMWGPMTCLCLWIMNRFCLKQQLWWWDFNTRKTAVWLIHEDVNKLEETRWLCQNFPWWDLHEHSLWLLFEGN